MAESHDNGQFELHAQPEGLNLLNIFATSAVSVALLIVTVFCLRGLYENTLRAEEFRKSATGALPAFVTAEEQATANLGTYGYDAETGVASIPLDQAIKETAERITATGTAFPELMAERDAALAADNTTSETDAEAASNDASDEENQDSEINN